MKVPCNQEEKDCCFRVRVCLERFFNDERARCFISVNGGRRVQWLRRRLRQLFALPARLALLCQGHLLPPDEPLSLLRHDDVVQVIPATIDLDDYEDENSSNFNNESVSFATLNNFDKSEINHEDNETSTPKQNSVDCPKKHKNNCKQKYTKTEENFEFNGDNRPKKRKPDNIQQQSTENGVIDVYLKTVHNTPEVNNCENTNIQETHELSDDSLVEMKERALALLDSCARAPRRRRVRRRRRPAPPPVQDALESDLSSIVQPLQPVLEHQTSTEGNINRNEPTTPEVVPESLVSLVNVSARSPRRVFAEASYTSVPAAAPAAPAWLTREAAAAPNVLQNNAVAPRTARLVRPLEIVTVVSG